MWRNYFNVFVSRIFLKKSYVHYFPTKQKYQYSLVDANIGSIFRLDSLPLISKLPLKKWRLFNSGDGIHTTTKISSLFVPSKICLFSNILNIVTFLLKNNVSEYIIYFIDYFQVFLAAMICPKAQRLFNFIVTVYQGYNNDFCYQFKNISYTNSACLEG